MKSADEEAKCEEGTAGLQGSIVQRLVDLRSETRTPLPEVNLIKELGGTDAVETEDGGIRMINPLLVAGLGRELKKEWDSVQRLKEKLHDPVFYLEAWHEEPIRAYHYSGRYYIVQGNKRALLHCADNDLPDKFLAEVIEVTVDTQE